MNKNDFVSYAHEFAKSDLPDKFEKGKPFSDKDRIEWKEMLNKPVSSELSTFELWDKIKNA